MKSEIIYKEINKMIIMDIKLDNFLAFRNFNLNMSYPKRIVNSYLEDEFLTKRPNFRYKKVNILMGANATGKTTFGKILMRILNFLDKKNYEALTDCIFEKNMKASFSIDLASSSLRLYRVTTSILPPKVSGKYTVENIKTEVRYTDIKPRDSYESCVQRMKEDDFVGSDNYITELEKLEDLSWLFQYTDDYQEKGILRTPENSTKYEKILECTLKTLDPSIEYVEKIDGLDDSYIIFTKPKPVIIQDGKIINKDLLSSGTREGIEIAGTIADIAEEKCTFYYCDEKFSYIHSDIEKAILSVIIDLLPKDTQLFFTTHNMDILDLPLPNHSFSFLKKDINDEKKTIQCVSASTFLKRNTDSLRHAVENDLFSAAPSTDLIYDIENL